MHTLAHDQHLSLSMKQSISSFKKWVKCFTVYANTLCARKSLHGLGYMFIIACSLQEFSLSAVLSYDFRHNASSSSSYRFEAGRGGGAGKRQQCGVKSSNCLDWGCRWLILQCRRLGWHDWYQCGMVWNQIYTWVGLSPCVLSQSY